jgi:hypothetical protein
MANTATAAVPATPQQSPAPKASAASTLDDLARKLACMTPEQIARLSAIADAVTAPPAAKPNLPEGPRRVAVETLDRSRAFGQVCGETAHNIAFTQRWGGIQGWPYDAHGKLIEPALTAEQREKLAERRARAVKTAQEEASQPPAPDEDLPEPDAPAPKEDATEEVNFVMWLKGEARYKPHELFTAAKARYGVNKHKLEHLALYLVEEKRLVARKEVHPSILPPLEEQEG